MCFFCLTLFIESVIINYKELIKILYNFKKKGKIKMFKNIGSYSIKDLNDEGREILSILSNIDKAKEDYYFRSWNEGSKYFLNNLDYLKNRNGYKTVANKILKKIKSMEKNFYIHKYNNTIDFKIKEVN